MDKATFPAAIIFAAIITLIGFGLWKMLSKTKSIEINDTPQPPLPVDPDLPRCKVPGCVNTATEPAPILIYRLEQKRNDNFLMYMLTGKNVNSEIIRSYPLPPKPSIVDDPTDEKKLCTTHKPACARKFEAFQLKQYAQMTALLQDQADKAIDFELSGMYELVREQK